MFDALVASLSDTRLEPDLDDLLWPTVNLFHRAVERIERQLDVNEQAQQKSQREQNGSEVRSVELERLTAEGISLIERRNCLELFRDQAIERFEVHTGSAWRPRSGSLVSHRTLTAAIIDSRDFIAAKRRSETEIMVPPGPKIALTGGLDFNDYSLVWDRLDKVHAKHPDMVLLHSASPKGAELIGSKWATSKCHRSHSNRIGPNTPRQRPSSAMTRCSNCCRSASCISPARAFRTTLPIRQSGLAFRSGSLAARERRLAVNRRVARPHPP